jgi:F-box and WD-40 domain protein 1/11
MVHELRHRLEATTVPPSGYWSDDTWIRDPDTASSLSPDFDQASLDQTPIRIHYPTLYHSRTILSRQLHSSCPAAAPHIQTIQAHDNAVYCLHVSHPWIITGSRDQRMRFWYLAPADGETRLIKIIEGAHEGSILGIDMDGGLMISGSSDMTAGIWQVELDGERGWVNVIRNGTLKGHTAPVLDVALSEERFITWCVSCLKFTLTWCSSKDETIRIYDKKTYTNLYKLDAHLSAVNSLAVNQSAGHQQLVSASADGIWIIWDLRTGQEIRRSTKEGKGLACIDWIVCELFDCLELAADLRPS